jgi:hypothetical protein
MDRYMALPRHETARAAIEKRVRIDSLLGLVTRPVGQVVGSGDREMDSQLIRLLTKVPVQQETRSKRATASAA